MLVSTSTLGGHVDTIGSKDAPGRRRRRLHSDEFKADADAVAAAARPGMSMAAVAMARGINAKSAPALGSRGRSTSAQGTSERCAGAVTGCVCSRANARARAYASGGRHSR